MDATLEEDLFRSFFFFAYIGPGAGFAFLGSFFILFVALLLALFAALTFPFRALIQLVTRPLRRPCQIARRVVIVGMDGLDPKRVSYLMDRGELPNFQKLVSEGTFSEMTTTCPPISPVAWSSFQTGVNPGKHNIFDFLNRDLRSYMPELSSCRTRVDSGSGAGHRKRASITLLRKSRAFWQILGEHGIFSTVLRVPVTYPPEKFNGVLLSGMCVPDIRGSQGTFTVYESGPNESEQNSPSGGLRIRVDSDARHIRTLLPGPTLGGLQLAARLVIDLDPKRERAVIGIGAQKLVLRKGEYSNWVSVRFGRGLRKVNGICRFLLCSIEPHFRLYVTPINIAPHRPALPISYPPYYSIYLAKLVGLYATLGLAEDTGALNDGILDEEAYLRQVRDIEHEREKMFLEALRRTRSGLCCCVFDSPDRVQHMFFRHLDTQLSGIDRAENTRGVSVVDEVYRLMDRLIGLVLDELDKDTVLFVVSDHGFVPFRRGVNLNAWLKQEGYLVEKNGAGSAEYLRSVDWAKTRAYTFGLSGIYLNIRGREKQGILNLRDCQPLKQEIISKLTGLRDPQTGGVAILRVYDSTEVYTGPYVENGPDLIVGYSPGYRASWEAAVGRTDGPLFSDNTRYWSGDHCVDFSVVPGLFASNRRVRLTGRQPHIMDIAPTVLNLFGISKPAYMDGEVLEVATD